MMMSGMISLQVDPKGRLRIPTKYRPALGEDGSKIFAMINSNGCLNIISQEKANEIISKLSKVVSIAVTEKSTAARLILSSVCELTEDGQGRFTLPPMLKKFAGISKTSYLRAWEIRWSCGTQTSGMRCITSSTIPTSSVRLSQTSKIF